MLILVIGGAASGKSEFAEDVCQRHNGRKAYVATMSVEDEESRRRVERHREMRRDKGFETVEHTLCAAYCQGTLAGYGVVLLECAGTLLANEMYKAQETAADAEAKILEYVVRIGSEVPCVVVVSNDVFGAGDTAAAGEGGGFVEAYIKGLASVNRGLAERADVVVDVVCGIGVVLKGDGI